MPEKFDAVVLIRGGGSRSDLNCFNAYRLAPTWRSSRCPFWTGIGHDKDTSVADMVAHTALKTPTAVAGWLVERMAETDGWLDCAALQLNDMTKAAMHASEVRLERLSGEVRRLSGELLTRQTLRLEHHFTGCAVRSGAGFRAAGRAARQCRGTDRRTFARTHPPAGIRRGAGAEGGR